MTTPELPALSEGAAMGVYLDFDRKASKDWTNSEYLTRFAQFVYSRAIAADRAARADPAADELRSAVLNAIYSRRITPAGNFDDAFNRGIDRAYGAADQVLSASAAAQPAEAQEPVAFASSEPWRINQLLSAAQYKSCLPKNRVAFDVPLYAHPAPKREPLTEEQAMRAMVNACDSLNITRVHEIGGKTRTICDEAGLLELARAVERAHGIGD